MAFSYSYASDADRTVDGLVTFQSSSNDMVSEEVDNCAKNLRPVLSWY